MTALEFLQWGAALVVWGLALAIVFVLGIAVHDFWRNLK